MCLLLVPSDALISPNLPMTNHDLRMDSGRHGTSMFLLGSWAPSLDRLDMIFEAYYRPCQGMGDMHYHMALIIG
jgi:hypothetical protein